MRSWVARYDLRSVRSLDEALQLLASAPGEWRPFAGGTDLMVLLEAGKLPHRRFVDIWRVDELRGIQVTDAAVRIGSLATYTDLLSHTVIAGEFPLLCDAARLTGAIAIQNRGTVGGNIANGSPAADLPPALIVYDAQLELASVRGRREVPYDRFHTGYKQMQLAPDELIVGITLPRGQVWSRQVYRKVGTRSAQAISKICLAAAADVHGGTVRDIRIALGSVAPTVVRATATESTVRGRSLDDGVIAQARAVLGREIAPIDDIRSTASYRLTVAANLLEDFLS